jgi:DNA polymerase-1
MIDQLVGISVSPAPGESYYVPVGHTGMMQSPQLPLNIVVERLKPIFNDVNKTKIAHNGKFDMEVLAGSVLR